MVHRVPQKQKQRCLRLCRARQDRPYLRQKGDYCPHTQVMTSRNCRCYLGTTALLSFMQLKSIKNVNQGAKRFGLIFNCITSGTVYVDLITDYSTKGFLMPFCRFVSIRGYPEKLHSDHRSVGSS